MKTLKLSHAEADFICWQETYYKNNVRLDNKRASRFAWRQAILKFPRLAKYERPIP